jgi:hypothetical protein
MSDAPERIWAYNEWPTGYHFTALGKLPEFSRVEYIRADIAEARIAELVALVDNRAKEEFAQSERYKGVGQHYKAREAAHTTRVLQQTANRMRAIAEQTAKGKTTVANGQNSDAK